MISVVIPSRNEPFLDKTIADVLAKATGEIEVIVVLDGYWPEQFNEDPRVTYIHRGESKGMRAGINAAVALARGEFILKTDAHCMFGEGFDEILAADCEEDWVVIPRRKRLEPETWTVQDVGKPDVDYEFLSYPDNPADFGGPGLNGRIWTGRILDRRDNPEYDIDDNLSFQGSAWFMHKSYFYQLELMDEEHYGTFWNEAQEIGFKTWLSGGRVITNKRTWYAHLHKGKKYGRGYFLAASSVNQGAIYTKKWMKNEAWDKQTLPFDWLIDKFWPLPGWPEDWKAQLEKD